MSVFLAILFRDLRLSVTRGSEAMVTLFFFIITASLFPFALGAEQLTLQRAAPAIIWVVAVLAALLSLENVYHRDYEDGTFDALLLSPVSTVHIILAKMTGHWIVSGITLMTASLVIAPMLFIPLSALPVLVLSLAFGSLYMSLLGGMGAVLTLGSRRPALLLAILVLPLYIPQLILGTMAMDAHLSGLSALPYLLLQLALVIVSLPLMPFVSAVLLKSTVRS
jgi:heme exporter protein B